MLCLNADPLVRDRGVGSNKHSWRRDADMAFDEEEDTTVYRVVVNHEEQYSIWPEYRKIPGGWRDVGKSGQKAECLAYIKEVWTDMRPLSLRKKMEAMKTGQNDR
jgi:MbtH protein